MPATAIEPSVESIGAGARRRLAGFARTLRDNGFTVGLAETRDALAILRIAGRRPAIVAQAGAARPVLPPPAPTGSGSTRSSTPTGAARHAPQGDA